MKKKQLWTIFSNVKHTLKSFFFTLMDGLTHSQLSDDMSLPGQNKESDLLCGHWVKHDT